jgi:hypothetical protein
MKDRFINKSFQDKSLRLISLVNSIVAEYGKQGFDLTLRQLYYQLVARDYIPNTVRSYKRLGNIVSDARLAGLVDWSAIVDRTRALRDRSHWSEPQEIIHDAERSYHVDFWEPQASRPQVWIEKDALIGVIAPTCRKLDVPFFACRGYVSQSEMYVAAQRVLWAQDNRHYPVILHLGDHDPSGMDMTRDIIDRLELMTRSRNRTVDGFRVSRLALNPDQIERYDPPPNPTKLSDSRAGKYVAEHGYSSWELDALEPSVIVDLIKTAVEALIDPVLWAASQAKKDVAKRELRGIRKNYAAVVEWLA